MRVIRDIFNEDFRKLTIQGNEAWEEISSYLGSIAPELSQRLEKYAGNGDLFADYRVEEQLAKAFDRKVYLPSGGSLVIDRTEAMVVIDVNTGKFIGKGGNLEETVTKNNWKQLKRLLANFDYVTLVESLSLTSSIWFSNLTVKLYFVASLNVLVAIALSIKLLK